MLNQLNKWHKTRSGYLAFAIIELAIAYGFASLAVDRGNLWYYLLSLIFFVGGLKNFFKLIGSFFHGRR